MESLLEEKQELFDNNIAFGEPPEFTLDVMKRLEEIEEQLEELLDL